VERKRYSRKFQRMAVARMETCEDVGELARELGVRPRCLYKWRRKLEMVEPGQEASRPSTHASAHRKEIHRLKQLLAEKTLEVDFFKGALQKVEARRQKRDGTGETASTSRSVSFPHRCWCGGAAKVVFMNILAEPQALTSACFLIEAKVDSSVDTRGIDICG
jgi:transposase